MSGHGLVTRIDASIIDSDERIQREVAEYVELHAEEIGEEIAECGHAMIPTFAGDYQITEEQLQHLVDVHSAEEVHV